MSADSEALLTILELHAKNRKLEEQLVQSTIKGNKLYDTLIDLKSGKLDFDSIKVSEDGTLDIP